MVIAIRMELSWVGAGVEAPRAAPTVPASGCGVFTVGVGRGESRAVHAPMIGTVAAAKKKTAASEREVRSRQGFMRRH
jgi:hypothetical protein